MVGRSTISLAKAQATSCLMATATGGAPTNTRSCRTGSSTCPHGGIGTHGRSWRFWSTFALVAACPVCVGNENQSSPTSHQKTAPVRVKKEKAKSKGRTSTGSTDDDFGFDPNAFKGGNGQQKKQQEQKPPPQQPKPDGKLREALELFELELPFTLDELKARRKQLLAKTHPDAGGSGFLFKQVENAFEILKRKAT